MSSFTFYATPSFQAAKTGWLKTFEPFCFSTGRPAPDGEYCYDWSVSLPESLTQTGSWLLPCFSCPGVEHSFQFAIRWKEDCVPLSPIGGPRLIDGAGGKNSAIVSDIDLFRVQETCADATVYLTVHTPDPALPEKAACMSLQHITPDRPEAGAVPETSAPLSVPAISQMQQSPEIARRICSPTCVAMVLQFLETECDAETVATQCYHRETDLYGVWPAAIHAAGYYGQAGVLKAFQTWEDVAQVLEADLPVIASIRYGAGSLPGAAMDATTGHLVVITGLDGDAVSINDPAADTAATVARTVPVKAFASAWMHHGGIGYVLFRSQT